MVKYVIKQGSDGKWYWHAVAKNNKIVADGGEGYSTRSNALRALRRFRFLAYSADIVLD